MIAQILQFLLWLFVWLILAWPPSLKNTIAGALVSAFVCFMTTDIFDVLYEKDGVSSHKRGVVQILKGTLWFVYYVVVFIWECLKANIDVAWRVIHPDTPIRPGTIKIKISLKSDIGLTFLANSLTLTPGNTSIDIDKENGFMYVHRLYIKDTGSKAPSRLAVAEKFEGILKNIFE